MIDKILKYNSINLLKKENFDNVYNKLKTQNYHLLGYYKDIIINDDFANASTIFNNGDFFCWHNYGSSAEKITKSNLRWLLKIIFRNCSYFAIVENDEYYQKVDDYYSKLFNERQKQLNNMDEA